METTAIPALPQSGGDNISPRPKNIRLSEVSEIQATSKQAIAEARDVLEAFITRNDSEEDTPTFDATIAALTVTTTFCASEDLARYWDGLLWSYDLEYSCSLEKYHGITSPAVLKAKLEKCRLSPDEIGFLVSAHALVQPYLDAMTWAVFEYSLDFSPPGKSKERRAIEYLAKVPEIADILAEFRRGRFDFAELNKRLLQRTGQCLDSLGTRC